MHPKVLLVCGYKNVGKTRLMTLLIKELTTLGYRVASIKHDGHEFDMPGSDSDRHHQAGAYASAVFSDTKWAMVKDESLDLAAMIDKFSDADIILIEGCKHSPYPKIEVLRKGVHEELRDDLHRIAVVADFPLAQPNVYHYEHPQPLVELIVKEIIHD